MKKHVTTSVSKIVDTVDNSVRNVERRVETITAPARESIIKRFPVFFTLAVTFGVTATYFGFERILMQVPFLYNRPLIILLLGIGVLVITGKLYKKLG